MKKITIILALILIYSCSGNKNEGEKNPSNNTEHNHKGKNQEHEGKHEGKHKEGVVELPEEKVKSLQLKIGKIMQQDVHTFVETYGEIGIPPQSRATITPVIGANVKKVLVVEGAKVRKGQVLAYIAHPDIIQFQMQYLKEYQKLQFLEAEYERQKKLYDEKISSEKNFQKVQSDYFAQKGIVQGYEQTLREININPKTVIAGKIVNNVPVITPIGGNVEKVFVHVGQYIKQGQEMFDIVNPHHLHLHLKVFEEDAPKVKVGQQIVFTTKSNPSVEHKAKVLSVGKLLEGEHRFINIHGHMEHSEHNSDFIPGMYVKAKIYTGVEKAYVLPEEAIIMDGDKRIAFVVKKKDNNYIFEPVEIELGNKEDSLYVVKLPQELQGKDFLLSGAYYIFSESQKG